MVKDKIIEIKKDIERAILDKDRGRYFYIELCSLLEDVLNSLKNEFHYAFDDADTLLPKTKKICDYINFDEKEKLVSIIRYRNNILHEASRDFPSGRYDFLEYCQTYNLFVSALLAKFPGFSILYKIDESIFNIDLTVVNEDQKAKEFSATAWMLEKDIKEREIKLEKLKNAGETNTRDFYHLQDLLLTSYKNIIPYYIDEHRLEKKYEFNMIEFEYGIGIYEEDFGFAIKGIRAESFCKNNYANCFAVIHGILTKNRIYKKSLFLQNFIDNSKFDYNEKYILRYQMIILSLLKNNMFDAKMVVNITDGTEEEFIAAFEDIKHYLELIFSLKKERTPVFLYEIKTNGLKLSVKNNSGDIYTSDNSTKKSNIYSWVENRRIFYSITEEDESVLNELAFNIFGIERLKAGQVEAIIKLLNNKENNLCLFPTGYGKSLIFYFLAFLSSACSIIINPTEALISDQKRNLGDRHSISNVETLDSSCDYGVLGFKSKLVYASSEIFLNRSFTEKLARLVGEGIVNNLVLDEVHCLSIWGHDFKPDYIMFAKYLNEYFSNVKVLGLTATANTKVLYDLKSILSVKDSNIIESSNLRRADITAEAVPVSAHSEIFSKTGKIINYHADLRWLTFVKNKEEGAKVSTQITMSYDECYDYDKDTYLDFVEGRNNILIVSHEMGIGINYPNVNCCVHVGYPISINQFVQEVGRIAREDNMSGKAFVVAQDSESFNEIETALLDINTPIEEILDIVGPAQRGESDISDLYKSIFDYLEGSGQAVRRIIEIYDSISSLITKRGELYFCPIIEERQNRMIRFYLIMLMQVGLLSKWFYNGAKDNISIYEIEKSDHYNNISKIKEIAISSVRKISSSDATVMKIKKAETIKDVILIFIQWYYNHYLDNQREQLVNLVQAVDEQDLSAYFEINFAELESVRQRIEQYELNDLLDEKEEFFDKRSIAIAVKLSELEYNPKYDLFLLWSKGRKSKSDFNNRLERIVGAVGEEKIKQNHKRFVKLYKACCEENKKKLVEKIMSIIGLEKVVFEFYNDFSEKELDMNYYEYVTILLNKKLEEK